ncbi:MAG: toprim domain-containing protein [Candidatus Paceibacterota bacterium]|jgi:recombination protein RecR
MDHLHKLHDLFRQFPGIGPRQAKRFVYYLLTAPESYRKELTAEISKLADQVSLCPTCHRFFDKKNKSAVACSICSDESREKRSLMVVAKDVDLDAIEKSHVYKGYYFVLGGTVPLFDQDPGSKLRSKELIKALEARSKEGLKEVILALSLNSEGEHTREHIEALIGPTAKKHGMTISTLGRGLSTGTELEYSDTETIKNALLSRKNEVI